MGDASYLPGKLSISGNRFTYLIGEGKAGEGTIRVDAKQSPRVLDASGKYFDKEEGFVEWVGIYKIEGNQLWVVAVLQEERIGRRPRTTSHGVQDGMG
jgi:uncharacterized protein (TIGR03067 family)